MQCATGRWRLGVEARRGEAEGFERRGIQGIYGGQHKYLDKVLRLFYCKLFICKARMTRANGKSTHMTEGIGR